MIKSGKAGNFVPDLLPALLKKVRICSLFRKRNIPMHYGEEVAYEQLLVLSKTFEDTGVRAYKEKAPNLMGTDFLMPSLQIHSFEARHASEVRRLGAHVIKEKKNVVQGGRDLRAQQILTP